MSWTVDQSGNALASGGELKHGGAAGSEKKGNAMWMDDKVGEGVHGWSFDISGGSGMWIGVGTEENFGAGYKLKGLLYGGPGNLSDGGALITGHWGPKFAPGDKIGMRLEVSGEHATLAFSKNGSGLGVAYDITGWTGGPPAGIAGSWQLDGENKWELSIEQGGPGQWRVGVKVSNSMSCSVTEGNGVFSAGPVMATQMMPPPELHDLETSVMQLLSCITGIARDGDKLLVTAGDRSEVFTVAAGSSPASKDQVRWMKN